ncbi:hypothetical protein CR970_00500 [Candidatus Saccharibacteria bacterium]|nr:MAG: hypothetical protein CR970_00500 [Candidatus Saccharibacteria bacterium]
MSRIIKSSFPSAINAVSKAKFFVIGVASLAIVVAVPVSAFAAPANAPTSAYGIAGETTPLGVVPNRYLCSQWTKLCVQINGAHVYGVPNACRMVWEWYGSGMHESGCTPGYWW